MFNPQKLKREVWLSWPYSERVRIMSFTMYILSLYFLKSANKGTYCDASLTIMNVGF